MKLFNLVNDSLYNSLIGRACRKIFRILKKNKNINKAQYGEMIVNDVIKLNPNFFPMFGTLLSLHRDERFVFADDFDFAIIGEFPEDIISTFENNGYQLCALSLIGNNREIIEYSFNKKINNECIKIDIFKLKDVNGVIRHSCPNFRKEKEIVRFRDGLKICQFNSYFTVDYPKFDLTDSKWGIKVPNDPDTIFELHYGQDWKTPKTSNFIDFSAYHFVVESSETILGPSEKLKKYIKYNVSY
ncbi:hypothetical protein [Escherichia albertii]|uniref:LicD family protein n=1 Tax=Escherichia albertii TaxID=208962 RepID=A0A5A4U5R6_ESCAL|nr:hypothetical protein [Escherichia albertii]EHX2146156.1 hypothetical protein [Escherichia albertii]BBM63119.1 hypothetical protein [Escherichia albertii]